MENLSQWYIVQVVSNYEQKVKESLENRSFEEGDSVIEEIFLPMEKKLTKTGKVKNKIIFPGYIFVKTIMSDESWYVIRNTQYVTGIVGSSGQRTKPTPIPQKQIETIVNRLQKANNELEEQLNLNQTRILKTDFVVGDWVEIHSGNFEEREGKVTEINLDKQNVTIEVDFFGRWTPIVVHISEVKLKDN